MLSKVEELEQQEYLPKELVKNLSEKVIPILTTAKIRNGITFKDRNKTTK